ncbi:ras-related protein Rab-32-like isoform X1 [Leptotrombidium deliense]|uniref:Ras-related protein Rab n=1 Tax=Leptotrombidium deliense TaxID=299467 RepID=A0A443SF80_9ACAR|nr:ras-related protein Rab-32-like isoform X1 [Leptotrombidium deliense]
MFFIFICVLYEEMLQKTYAKLRKHVKEYFLKLLIVGEIATGKTSFINRYVHNHFSSKYRATTIFFSSPIFQIGLDFALKVLNWDKNTIVRLQLWDIAGQERFGTMTRVYYKDAVGAFIVFDVSRKQSFDQIIKWKSDLDAKVCLPDGNPLPSVLLANKCDLHEAADANAVNASSLDQFCEKHKFAGWFYTSAKDNVNVDESANFLIGKVLEKHTLFLDSWRMQSDVFSLENNDSYNPQQRLNNNTCNC